MPQDQEDYSEHNDDNITSDDRLHVVAGEHGAGAGGHENPRGSASMAS